ncbi:MAG: hypothetical protein ACXV7J_06685 [Methylomonas sp.]
MALSYSRPYGLERNEADTSRPMRFISFVTFMGLENGDGKQVALFKYRFYADDLRWMRFASAGF